MKYVWNVMRSFKNARKLINWNSWQIKDREEKIVKTIEELSPPWVAEEYKRTEHQDKGQKIDEEFSKIELERALNVVRRNTTPGRDRIDYYMIKELLKEEFKEILLRIYNAVWKHGFIPRKWREYQVIFIDKIGKEKVKPISLSSWMGKIMERMVSERLVWWIEKNQILYLMQNGFRKGKSCLENLAKLMAEVRSQGLIGGYSLQPFWMSHQHMTMLILI